MSQTLIFTNDCASELNKYIKQTGITQVFILADSNTAAAAALPLKAECWSLVDAPLIVIEPSDIYKNIDLSLIHI